MSIDGKSVARMPSHGAGGALVLAQPGAVGRAAESQFGGGLAGYCRFQVVSRETIMGGIYLLEPPWNAQLTTIASAGSEETGNPSLRQRTSSLPG